MWTLEKVNLVGAAPRCCCALIVVVLTGVLVPAADAGTAPLPGAVSIDDFEISDDYAFELDGVELAAADVYFSRYEVAYLVAAPELERPLLLSPRGHSVQAVEPGRLSRGRGVGAELPAGSVAAYLGRYRKEPGAFVFEVGGKTARLVERPPAVGSHSAEDLGKRHRRYRLHARSLQPRHRVDAAELGGRTDLVVRVYFASWSPACARILPEILRLESDLKNRVRFDYVGLSKLMTRDPRAQEAGIYSAPTAVVLRGGEEIGRLDGRPLDTEGNLYALLKEAAKR